jgi:hypothetical protein
MKIIYGVVHHRLKVTSAHEWLQENKVIDVWGGNLKVSIVKIFSK